jgi:excisionase family DNA binding protein
MSRPDQAVTATLRVPASDINRSRPFCGASPAHGRFSASKMKETIMHKEVQAAIRLQQASGDFAYSVPQAAERANVSSRTVWRLIGKGKIATVRISARRRVILASEPARYLKQGVDAA